VTIEARRRAMIALLRRGSRWQWLAAAWLLAAATAIASQDTPRVAEPIDVQRLGPQVGARVPDFSLRDQHGRERTLSSLIARNGLMLVFFRSADW
jgi:hypothetical protein